MSMVDSTTERINLSPEKSNLFPQKHPCSPKISLCPKNLKTSPFLWEKFSFSQTWWNLGENVQFCNKNLSVNENILKISSGKRTFSQKVLFLTTFSLTNWKFSQKWKFIRLFLLISPVEILLCGHLWITNIVT